VDLPSSHAFALSHQRAGEGTGVGSGTDRHVVRLHVLRLSGHKDSVVLSHSPVTVVEVLMLVAHARPRVSMFLPRLRAGY
jgi:hypothetical protein